MRTLAALSRRRACTTPSSASAGLDAEVVSSTNRATVGERRPRRAGRSAGGTSRRIGGEVLVAEEEPVGVLGAVAVDDGVDHVPEQRSLVDDVRRPPCERLDVGPKVGHQRIDEAGLVRKWEKSCVQCRRRRLPAYAAGCLIMTTTCIPNSCASHGAASTAIGSFTRGRSRRSRCVAKTAASRAILPASRADRSRGSSAAYEYRNASVRRTSAVSSAGASPAT